MSDRVLWTDREKFMKTGIERISEVDVLLDIGCGIVPHDDYITPYIYICCEPYTEYVEVLKKKIENNTESLFAVLNYDWEEVVNKFGAQSVDTVFILDVIEHLDKKTGERLLKLTEKIARKQIVIFTPLGFVENKTLHDGKDAWGLNGAEWQEHKSGWLPEDFDNSWEIVACKDIYKFNNIGEELDKPFGALWAIKNINNSGEEASKLFNQHDNLLPVLFEQGKRVFRITKQEKAILEQEKTQLEQEKAILEQEKTRSEQDKTRLEQEKAILEQDKTRLEQEKTILEQEKAILQQEKTRSEQEKAILEEKRVIFQQEIANLERENAFLKKRYRFFEIFRKNK